MTSQELVSVSENFLMNSQGFTFIKEETIFFDVYNDSFDKAKKDKYSNKAIIGLHPLNNKPIPNYADGFGYFNNEFDVIKVFDASKFLYGILSLEFIGFLLQQKSILYISVLGEPFLFDTVKPYSNEVICETIDELESNYPKIYDLIFHAKPESKPIDPKAGYKSNILQVMFRDYPFVLQDIDRNLLTK